MGKGAVTRSRILDEAMRIASRDGLEGLTIGVLAKALQLSKSGLFVHFGSREALQIAVLEHTLERFKERVVAPLEAIPPGPERLWALFRGWLDWFDAPELPGGCPFLAAAFELDDREGAPRDFLASRQKVTQQFLARCFHEVATHDADLAQLVFEFRAITLAYHYFSRMTRDPRARDHATRAFESLLERAARPLSSPSP